MKNKTYSEMILAFKELTENDKQMFIDTIMKLTKNENDRMRYSCDTMITEATPKEGTPDCPYCGSKASLGFILKQGFYKNGSQRYSCKSCKKYFTNTTNTVFEGTRKTSDTWRKYIYMTVSGKGLRACAEECEICFQTAFTWRHKILNAFKVHQDTLLMNGKIEVDEMFFPVSFKGNHIKGSFAGRKRLPGMSNNLPRKSFRRGSDNKSNAHSDKACVFCMIKNGNELFYAEVPGVGFMKPDMLDATLAKHVNKDGSVVIADQYRITQKYLEENGYEHVILSGNTAENTRYHRPEIRGEYHLQHVNAMHRHIRAFMKPYCGVSTKYLPNYIALYTWLKNIAANKKKNKAVEMSIYRASTSDCYISRRSIEAMPAIPKCA